jgi:hypothetical protein
MRTKKFYSFCMDDTDRRLLEKLARVEKGRMNYSKTIVGLIRAEGERVGLLKSEAKK